MGQFQPFNHDEPMDIMTELFRRKIVDVAMDADKITVYRDMTPQQQLECFVSGVLCGLLGVCFASIRSDQHAREAIMAGIASCLPAARQHVESSMQAALKTAQGEPK